LHYRLILPDIEDRCGIGGGLNNKAFKFRDLEDLHILLETAGPSSGTTFNSSEDFITIAFYSFYRSGGGTQTLKLVAVDRTKYYFQDETPVHQPPVFSSSEITFSLDENRSKLSISWSEADDLDTLQKDVSYEFDFSTSTVLDDNNWIALGNRPETSIYVAVGYDYLVGVRALDDFDLVSKTLSSTFFYPSGSLALDQSQSDTSSGLWSRALNSCNPNFTTCYKSASLQSLKPSQNLTFQQANVKISQTQGSDRATVRLSIHADKDSKPDYSVVHAFATLSGIGGVYNTELTFTFADPVTLEGDKAYWFVLEVISYSGGRGFYRSSFVNALASGGDAIPNGIHAYRPASEGSIKFVSKPSLDWFLILFE